MRPLSDCRFLVLLLLTALGLSPNARADLFRDRIAPILEQRCLNCHDSANKKGGLDLSSTAGIAAGSDSGVVLVAGKSAQSKLFQVISGPNPRMPRSEFKLSETEVALVRRWIDAGASWPEDVILVAKGKETKEQTWWSLRPLVRPQVPQVKSPHRLRNPIDAFLLARLEDRGLSYSREADRGTLIRRLTFDLTGLPPTPEDVDAFVNDVRVDAYERLVERLLASPAYGERWARHWLDIANYADTHGYDKDRRRDHAWRYRDWVIAALNRELPYGQFIREQLAGDVLRSGQAEGIISTGFVVAGPWDLVGQTELREGTVDKEKTRVLDRDDMVSNTIGTFLSLTVGCARCHDHKFDPISSKEYYQLQSFFAGVERGDRPLETAELSEKRQRLLTEQKNLQSKSTAIQAKIDALTDPTLRKLMADIARLEKQRAALTLPMRNPSPTNGYHSQLTATADATKWVQVDLGESQNIEKVHLFPARPTDFADTPGFGFPVRYKVEASATADFAEPILISDRTKEDQPNPGHQPVSIACEKLTARYLRITATKLWKRLDDYCFALAEVQIDAKGRPLARGKSITAMDTIDAGRWSTQALVDGFDSREQLPDASKPKEWEQFLKSTELSQTLRASQERHAFLRAKLIPLELQRQQEELNKQQTNTSQSLAALTGPMVYSVKPIAPRRIQRLHRGDVEKPKEEVAPCGLDCLPNKSKALSDDALKNEGQRRLALADWIADEANVLTWRSIVNRVWHYHFGKGIVDTPSDFGKMGSLPSHPELLDWLAVEFRDNHGRLKALHRLIVSSSAYRQMSDDREDANRIDADNRLLWRQNRRRLDAESVRDAVLAVSGRLDRRIGGMGYDLFRFRDDHSPEYDHADINRLLDPATYRRTIYRFTVRSVPNPFLECLDCADPNVHTPVRNTTLTALQALALLNNPFMVRQSQEFAARVEAEPHTRPDSLAAQVERAWRLALGRKGSAEELAVVVAYARKHGLAGACRVLLNANEFVFVD